LKNSEHTYFEDITLYIDVAGRREGASSAVVSVGRVQGAANWMEE
jgi:hypothetical protein